MLSTLFAEHPRLATHAGCARYVCRNADWRAIGEALREQKLSLLAIWGERDGVQAALYDAKTGAMAIASLEAIDTRVPSLGIFHAPAIRLERALQDLYGLTVIGLPDARPWLDHGRWGVHAPLAAHPTLGSTVLAPRFLPAAGPSLHEIPVGPVHAGIIEPGHFRFSAHGELVVRLEQRLGYAHKGIEKLMAGRELTDAAKLAARVSGDSTVAYSFAFARAVELAMGFQSPPRAVLLRGVMAELERIANHLGDIGAICNDAAFTLLNAEFGIWRERALRACFYCFGHRLMMDRIIPGGVTTELSTAGIDTLINFIKALRQRFPELVELYDHTASLQDRTVSTGVVSAMLAEEFAAGGYIGRASGRSFDTRSALPYEPYIGLPIAPVQRTAGDVDARVWVRIEEVNRSLDWLEQALAAVPAGEIYQPLAATLNSSVDATAIVEGFRGDILVYVRLDRALHIERCHVRDPSWFQWPLLEAAIDGNIVADFPLCNKSFNCSYSGHDL